MGPEERKRLDEEKRKHCKTCAWPAFLNAPHHMEGASNMKKLSPEMYVRSPKMDTAIDLCLGCFG